MDSQPSTTKTLLLDILGGVAVIWAIPLGIVIIGAPIALAFALVRWLVHAL